MAPLIKQDEGATARQVLISAGRPAQGTCMRLEAIMVNEILLQDMACGARVPRRLSCLRAEQRRAHLSFFSHDICRGLGGLPPVYSSPRLQRMSVA
jgi:hypothetical protein